MRKSKILLKETYISTEKWSVVIRTNFPLHHPILELLILTMAKGMENYDFVKAVSLSKLLMGLVTMHILGQTYRASDSIGLL
jgi:hypothetical protein